MPARMRASSATPARRTYLLGRWVREKQALSLEEAVRMLTSRPAEVFGITDRGRLAEGWPADVVVFDPATVGAGPLRRVHDFPGGANRLVSDASGIDAVIVNGAVLRRDGRDALDPTARCRAGCCATAAPLDGRMTPAQVLNAGDAAGDGVRRYLGRRRAPGGSDAPSRASNRER